MFTAQSFARAMSPAMEGLTAAMVTGIFNGPHDGNNAKAFSAYSETLYNGLLAKISAARSIDKVIEQILVLFRAIMRDRFLAFASWADKRETCILSLDRLEAAIATGNTPQRLHMKAPVFQLMQEFRRRVRATRTAWRRGSASRGGSKVNVLK
ncbi:hypothetical protein HGRIS_011999 [Hohenbuehelia grisea]|uniref:Uncharacterized protein n=1 Tax=Hohenbuehelia grisea TaxID=104357 RepID=A0ABR3JY80_9AGAR